MEIARNPGESIRAHKIAYAFGRVVENREGVRRVVSLGLKGRARVLVKFTRRKPGEPMPVARPSAPRELAAGSARGLCDSHKQDRKKQHGKDKKARVRSSSSHRTFSGVLSGAASVEVVTPLPGNSGS